MHYQRNVSMCFQRDGRYWRVGRDPQLQVISKQELPWEQDAPGQEQNWCVWSNRQQMSTGEPAISPLGLGSVLLVQRSHLGSSWPTCCPPSAVLDIEHWWLHADVGFVASSQCNCHDHVPTAADSWNGSGILQAIQVERLTARFPELRFCNNMSLPVSSFSNDDDNGRWSLCAKLCRRVVSSSLHMLISAISFSWLMSSKLATTTQHPTKIIYLHIYIYSSI